MANAYSILHNYTQELYRPPMQQIEATLQAKQGAYNYNKQKLDALYDQLDFLDVAKGVDKDYTENRLRQAKDIVDKYRMNGDLSNSQLVSQLTSKYKEVIDDNVISAVTSTKLYRAEQKQWEDLKKNSPEKYSDVNRAYAARSSNEWLQDNQVGRQYNGGGGVIEYTDVYGKFLENIPTIEKQLKVKYVQEGPGVGYFRSTDTFEVIPRESLNNVLDNLFDENDQRQLNIDAWGRYQNRPDEVLKQEFNNYYGERLQNVRNALAGSKIALAEETDPDKRSIIEGSIRTLEDNIKSLESNTYDNVVKVYGRDAAFSTLHNEQFKENILDTFTKPSFVERKIDQASKEYANYQIDIAKLQIDKEKLSLEGAKVKNRLRSSSIKQEGVPSQQSLPDGVFVGDEIEVNYDEDGGEKDFTSELLDHRQNSYNELSSSLDNIDVSSDVLADPEVVAQIRNFEGLGQIVLEKDSDGNPLKTLNVEDNYELLNSYRDNVINESEGIKSMKSDIKSMLRSIEKKLYIADILSDDIDIYDTLPAYNFKIVDDGKGGFKYKRLEKASNKDRINKYASLIREKNSLKEGSADRLTLDVYEALHLYQDPNISDTERKAAKLYVDGLLKNLPIGDARTINTDKTRLEVKNGRYIIPNTDGLWNYIATDQWLSQIDKGDLEIDGDASENRSKAHERGNLLYPDNLKEAIKEREYIVDNYTLDPAGIGGDISTAFGKIERNLSSEYASRESSQLARTNSISITSKSDEYNQIRNSAGIKDVGFKDTIDLKQEIVDGKVTGNVTITYKPKDEDEEVKPITVPVTKLPESLQKVFTVSRYPYDASRQNSKSIPLGNNKFDDSHPVSRSQKVDYEAYEDNLDNRYKEEVGEDGMQEIYSELDKYKNGQFNFKLEPVNGVYGVIMYEKGEKVSTPFIIQSSSDGKFLVKFGDNHRKQIYTDPRSYTHAAFDAYIKNKASELKSKAKRK